MKDHPLLQLYDDIALYLYERMSEAFTTYHTILLAAIRDDSPSLNRYCGQMFHDIDTFTAYIFVLSDVNTWGEKSQEIEIKLVEINQALQASVVDIREVMRLSSDDDRKTVKRYCESAFRKITRSLELLKETVPD